MDENPGETLIRGLRWESLLHNHSGGFADVTISLNDILALDVAKDSGTFVFFMPSIKDSLEHAKTATARLSERFFVPSFFFENVGWNSNGFFGSFDTHEPFCEGNVHVTFFRYLTKAIMLSPGKNIEYEWDYLGFSTITRLGASGVADLHILFCFDLSSEAEQQLRSSLLRVEDRSRSEPFILIKVVAEFVAFRLEEYVWKVQPFVRNIEKSRREYFYPEPLENFQAKSHKDGLENVICRYNTMHELARHLIHIMETLGVAVNTMQSIVEDHKALCLPQATDQRLNSEVSLSRRVACELKFSVTFVTNLHKRAEAFVARIQNEIHLGFNMVAAVDSTVIRTILDRTNEGKDFADAVAFATFIFIPAALISSFFGMNFFVLSPQSSPQNPGSTSSTLIVSPKLWIFFVVSGICTTSLLVPFLFEINPVSWLRKKAQSLKRATIQTSGSKQRLENC